MKRLIILLDSRYPACAGTGFAGMTDRTKQTKDYFKAHSFSFSYSTSPQMTSSVSVFRKVGVRS